MLIPSARSSAPRSAASDVSALGRLLGERRPRWAARRALPPSAAPSRPRRRRPRAAATRHRRGSAKDSVVPDRRPAPHEQPARPRRRCRAAPRASAGASPSTPIMSVIASRARSGRSAVADAARCWCHLARSLRPSRRHPHLGSRTRARGGSGPAGRPPRSGGGGTPRALDAAAPGRPPRRDEAAAETAQIPPRAESLPARSASGGIGALEAVEIGVLRRAEAPPPSPTRARWPR